MWEMLRKRAGRPKSEGGWENKVNKSENRAVKKHRVNEWGKEKRKREDISKERNSDQPLVTAELPSGRWSPHSSLPTLALPLLPLDPVTDFLFHTRHRLFCIGKWGILCINSPSNKCANRKTTNLGSVQSHYGPRKDLSPCNLTVESLVASPNYFTGSGIFLRALIPVPGAWKFVLLIHVRPVITVAGDWFIVLFVCWEMRWFLLL